MESDGQGAGFRDGKAADRVKRIIPCGTTYPYESFLSIEFVKVVINSKYLRYAGDIWLVFSFSLSSIDQIYVFKTSIVLHQQNYGETIIKNQIQTWIFPDLVMVSGSACLLIPYLNI